MTIQARLLEMAEDWQGPMGKLVREAADEIARLTEEVERLTRLDRANHAAIDVLQANPDAFQHFECATIIDNMKSKADALAEAVLALHEDFITDIGCDPDMSNTRINNTLKLLAALIAYQEGK